MSHTVLVYSSSPKWTLALDPANVSPDFISSICVKRPEQYGLKTPEGHVRSLLPFPPVGGRFSPVLGPGDEVQLFGEGLDAVIAKLMEDGAIAGGAQLPLALRRVGDGVVILGTGAVLMGVGLLVGLPLLAAVFYFKADDMGNTGLEKTSVSIKEAGDAHASELSILSEKHLEGLKELRTGTNAGGMWIAAGFFVLAGILALS